MCGIYEILNYKNTVDTDQLLSMTTVIRRHGPDEEGQF